MITIGTLFLVIGAVEKSHVVDFVARKTFGMTGSVILAQIRMYATCFALSIFFNNTPLVAILLPVVKDWGRVRDVAASQLLIPLSYSVMAGSFVSMIGTSTNLTVQGLMQADRGYSFDFFAPAPLGIPLFAILLVYQIATARFLLPHHKSGLLRAVRDQVDSLVAEVLISYDSIFVGQGIELMMNSLGMAPSRVIKIRRRVTPRTEEELRAEQEERQRRDKAKRKELRKSQSSSALFDRKYLKEFMPFWKKQNNTAVSDQNYETTNPDERGNPLPSLAFSHPPPLTFSF
jgi:di/tricarboxylate transporter